MLHLVPTSLVLVLTFEHISLIILVLSKYFLEFFIQTTWLNGLSQIYEDQMMKQNDQILVFHNFAKIKWSKSDVLRFLTAFDSFIWVCVIFLITNLTMLWRSWSCWDCNFAAQVVGFILTSTLLFPSCHVPALTTLKAPWPSTSPSSTSWASIAQRSNTFCDCSRTSSITTVFESDLRKQVDADNVRANIPAATETIFNDQTANRQQPSVRGWTWRPGEDAET